MHHASSSTHILTVFPSYKGDIDSLGFMTFLQLVLVKAISLFFFCWICLRWILCAPENPFAATKEEMNLFLYDRNQELLRRMNFKYCEK